MLIVHERYGFGNDTTLAAITIEGCHECFMLEDERRVNKVYGETCISEGRYEIKLRTEGSTHEKYKIQFPRIHRGMLWFQNVPGFTFIYYHIGNCDEDTLGCPLTGQLPVILPDGEFEVARSEKAYLALYKRVMGAFDAGERVFVIVREREPVE